MAGTGLSERERSWAGAEKQAEDLRVVKLG
jgi:hypothetical protein